MSALTSRIWALKQTFHAIWHQRSLFLMGLALASLAMTIPFFLSTLTWSLSGQIFDVPTQTEMTIFTSRSAGAKTVQNLAIEIEKDPIFASVKIMDKKEAFDLINQSLGLETDRNKTNPLPDLIIATVAPNVSAQELAATATRLKKMKNVDSVAYDDQWATSLSSLNKALTVVLVILGSVVGLLVLLVIFASVRLTTGAQRDEIRALYTFGATHSFIRRPYLWRGIVTLTLASLISLGLTSLALNMLDKPISDFVSLYGVSVSLRMPAYDWCILYVTASALLGWIVSSFAAASAIQKALRQRN